jgi:Protein of unknown function (DUF4231)
MKTPNMGEKSAAPQSPPRAGVAFRVGIVGHRPNRLPQDPAARDALQKMIGRVLDLVRREVSRFQDADRAGAAPFYAAERPILRAVSPLAEGSDRMFAAEAIELGYELLCPMPFYREEFENDFLPPRALEENSLERFRELLRRAETGAGLTAYELDGQRSASAEAYGMAGRLVLNQSDLLIVVWDRGKPAGGGGTVQTLREAAQYRVPALWINALNPHEWRVLLSEDDIAAIERGETGGASDVQAASMESAIERIVAAELDPPRPATAQTQLTQLNATEYFREIRPRRNYWIVWKLFRDLVADGRPALPKIAVADFEVQISADWPIKADREGPPVPEADGVRAGNGEACSTMEDWVNRRLRPQYAWADKLADWYADHYRSAYVSIYLLSALGVLIALAGHAAWWAAALEFVCIVIIVALVMYGSRRHWHERWMEYRLLAELIRQIRIKIPLGGGRPLPRTPIHLGIYEDLTQTWMYWHMRAVARATGIPAARVAPQYLLDCLGYMDELVRNQLNFHNATRQRSKRIAELLHSIASNLFLISLYFVAIRLIILATDYWAPGVASYLPIPLSLAVLAGALVLRSSAVFLLLAALLAIVIVGLNTVSFQSVIALFLVLAVLPAFGAAITGIANQGEFARLEKRSIAMAGAFVQFQAHIKELRARIENEPPTTSMMASVIALASEITQIMVDEVSDWRVVVAEQPVRW